MHDAKVVRFEGSLGIVLPAVVAKNLGVVEGAVVTMVESECGYMLIGAHTEVEQQLHAADGVINRYRDTLRRLAE